MGFFAKLFGINKKKDEANNAESQVDEKNVAQDLDDQPIADVMESQEQLAQDKEGKDSESIFANDEASESIAEQVEEAEKKEPSCDSSKNTKTDESSHQPHADQDPTLTESQSAPVASTKAEDTTLAEQAQLAAQAEQERLEAERLEAERIAAEKAEQERLEAEAAAAEAAEAAEAEKANEEAQAQESAKEAMQEERKSFFSRLKKTRDNLAFGVSSLIFGRKIDEDLYEDLETALLTADLGVETTQKVIERLRDESRVRDLRDAGALRNNLKKILSEILYPCEKPLIVYDHTPFVILMVGVNGAGKTTTIGKLARKYQDMGLKVMLAAGDTFRAAAVEQLKEWGERANVPVIAQATGSDSASVLYDAVSAAKARGIDVLLCDTAGRLQNKDHLMEELRKIVRVMQKIDPKLPHETMLVLDAATGQNAVSQTKVFTEAVNVTGLTLTKLDGSAKGGVVFSLANLYEIPIRYVGIGEKAEDLREFKIDPFVDALVEDEDHK